jgi:hypothetical protein
VNQAPAKLLISGICVAASVASAQDLTPRAYLITPAGSNAVTFVYSYNTGSVFVDPSLPVEGAKINFQVQALSYYRSYSLWGRSSNLTLLAPYILANGTGVVEGSRTQLYRSGLADGRIRLAINLKGGRAVPPREFASWHEKVLIGASLTVTAPTGQYDPARVVNGGANRWGFKPEIGFSRRWSQWVIDGYAGVWLFTANKAYFPGTRVRTQESVGAGEVHLTRYFKPRLWASLDGNFWAGGRSAVDGHRNQDRQRNSRAGITVAVPVTSHQSLKFSYARGAYVHIGGNYSTVSMGWQYSWVDKRD